MALQLDYSNEFRCFVMTDPYARCDDASYQMVIEHPLSDEYRYRFLIWEDGDWSEMKTKAELAQMVQDVRDHEGDEVAAIWEVENSYYVVRDDHPCFAWRRKWEAMVELNLFTIPINYNRWQGKPLSQEALDKMDAARDKWQREEAEEMEDPSDIPETGEDWFKQARVVDYQKQGWMK